MFEYVKEVATKKSSKNGKDRSFKHLLFLLLSPFLSDHPQISTGSYLTTTARNDVILNSYVTDRSPIIAIRHMTTTARNDVIMNSYVTDRSPIIEIRVMTTTARNDVILNSYVTDRSPIIEIRHMTTTIDHRSSKLDTWRPRPEWRGLNE